MFSSPSLKSTSSYSNLRKNRIGSTSSSTSTTRSSSPVRSRSSDIFAIPGRIRIRKTNHGNLNNDSYNGTISVSIRTKPVGINEKCNWYVETENKTIIHTDIGEYTYDNVFHPDASNFDVYAATCKPLIDKLFDGFNSTVFAYGMTGSGKTYTMSGVDGNAGLIPLSVAYMYSKIFDSTIHENKKYDTLVSYLEIYNEKIYDLLETDFDPKPLRSSIAVPELKIRDDPNYGVRVIGLTEKRCQSHEELLNWIKLGDKHRKTSSTDFNTRSSRSHAIILIRLISSDLSSGEVVTSTLSLCDLAGSERVTAQHERRQEGSFINKSLLALGTVISKLSAEVNNSTESVNNSHIPYRDSKLTRILQPALSGNSIVTTICTIDTSVDATNESVNTLRFASRAKNVSLHVVKKSSISAYDANDQKDRIIESLVQQLQEQKIKIEAMENNYNINSFGDNETITSSYDPSVALLENENKILRYKLEHCERLLDKDTNELHDKEIANIADILPLEIGMLLETKFQGLESQIREFKNYTDNLEKEIMEKNTNKKRILSTSSDLSMKDIDDCETEKLDSINPKDAEIAELKKTLERKDKLIDALQSARRLRERALQPLYGNNSELDLEYTNK
ncbi:hypothetical protein Kpol_1013p7 [Vanderwaltozyma polyspora DSM 70294]|uniref:Kinesin-like protein n=1 Tax=Vanderwaltozyma polyspora (strain ATCC 22028 / DSM 70294 / BCRC 21397 / CBS 2163 / NBRC 10782 / NRRL Y-8283 / UCD 57-17) TaxID=436907 RepID=A7TH55_VANPO|nr:uncharacterized protein Kpol_1013p7 [Vanderwaltozyma polyspora DSM 70294]EDO18336.1 hypothetical protein Kpol_1013p7 [Vanderwaltozyma polyspora DSM 70294]